jgi:membrane protease YdiL (CAAX protease family)
MKELKKYLAEISTKESIIALSSLIFMTLYVYHGIPKFFYSFIAPVFGELMNAPLTDFVSRAYQCLFVFITFFVLPALIVKLKYRESISDYGFQKGDTSYGFRFLLIAIPVVLPFIYISSFKQDFQQEYPLPLLARSSTKYLLLWECFYLFYYIGWEFLFRGYLLFGLEKKIGDYWAILFQTLPSTIIHIGKPEGETISAIIAGIAFGAVALRTRSILYPLLLHYIVGLSMDVFSVINSR